MKIHQQFIAMKWHISFLLVFLAVMVTCNPLNMSSEIEVINSSSVRVDSTAPTTRRYDLSTTAVKWRDYCEKPRTEPHRVLPEGDDHKGICYNFSMRKCVKSAEARGVPKYMEPDCYPKVEKCGRDVCYNWFALKQDCLPYKLDGWMGNLVHSGCGYPYPGLIAKANAGSCKHADIGVHNIRRMGTSDSANEIAKKEHDFAKCYCTGPLCNQFDNTSQVHVQRSRTGPLELLRPVQNDHLNSTPAFMESSTLHPPAKDAWTNHGGIIFNMVCALFGVGSTLALIVLGIKIFRQLRTSTSNTCETSNKDIISEPLLEQQL